MHKDKNGKVRIFSRTLDEVTEFPELVQPIRELPGELILDGEILAWRDTRPLPFTELQKRLGRKQIDMWMQHDIPVKFVAFDLLYQDGELLLDERLADREKDVLLRFSRTQQRRCAWPEGSNAKPLKQCSGHFANRWQPGTKELWQRLQIRRTRRAAAVVSGSS